MQKREEWVENLKGFGILLVILGHIQSPFTPLIFSFHMPLFFFIAGFFNDSNQKFSFFFKKNIKRIFYPFFVFFFFGNVVEIVKRLYFNRQPLEISDILYGILYMDYPHLSESYGFVLWFLPALFFGKLFDYVLQNLNKFLAIICSYLLMMIGLRINMPFSIDEGMVAANFILMGRLIYSINRSIFLLIPTIISLIIVTFIGIPELNLSMKYFSSLPINLIWIASSLVVLTFIFKKLNYSQLKLINFAGRNSLLIFLIHPYTNNLSDLIVNSLIPTGFIFKFILSVLFALTLVYILKSKTQLNFV